jgi:hypothetical protein
MSKIITLHRQILNLIKTRKSDLHVMQNLKKMQQKISDIPPNGFISIPANIKWNERNSNQLYSSYY